MPEIDSFEKLVSVLNEAKKLSSQIESSWEKIEKASKGASESGIGGNVGGQAGHSKGRQVASSFSGSGAPKKTGAMPSQGDMAAGGGTGLGRVAAAATRAVFGGSRGGGRGSALNSFMQMQPEQQQSISSNLFGLGDALALFQNMSSATAQFLPGVSDTMNRATKYYNATTYGGNQMSRNAVQSATFGTLGGMAGITSAGSDAAVAQILSGRGMTVSSDPNSTYQQTLRTVANAGRYLNISNEQAAASVEGLTSAKGSANMLRNFGIYTADLSTGKEKTQGQIFQELADRLTAGRGQATVEQTQASIRRGALGVTIDSFFQGDQQGAQMFKQYMIERAGGKTMDLSQATPMGGPAGNQNPLQPQMNLATKQTGAMGMAESEFIKGVTAATGALSALTDASGGLASVIGGASSLLQTLLGNQSFKGLTSGATSLVNFASKGITGISNTLAGLNPLNPAPSLLQAGVIAGGMTAAIGGVAAMGGVAQMAANAFGGTGGSSSSLTGSIGSPFSGKGASVSTAFNPSSDFSNIPGMRQGDAVTSSSGTGSPAIGQAMVSLDYLSGVQHTTEYGEPQAVVGGIHHGTDYGLPAGADVKAVADGVVWSVITSGQVWTQAQIDSGRGPGGIDGNQVKLKHTAADGTVFFSMYNHLSQVLVSTSDQVTRGQVIGKVGRTGAATGPHLHLEFQNSHGTPIPPGEVMGYLEGANSGGQATSSSGSYSQKALTDAMTQGAKYQQMPTAAVNAFNTLQSLYSGDTSQILAAVNTMGGTLGISPSILGQYMNATNPTAGTPAASAAAAAASGGGAVNNNVSITVQVPDVTSADALKFANLVKSYLDNNTLMSNTGSV
jgi:murein DD-endopeptidase MepM/ murein hydrolase activator NlpD